MQKQHYDVKWVARSNDPTKNYHLNLQLPSALQSFIAGFSSQYSCLAAGSLF